MAVERKPLGKILKQLEHIGEFHTDRINIHINPAQKTLCWTDWRRVWTDQLLQ